ncbi:MAG TPA: hypothetical protein VH092_19820 [Urbifossiella sp.]|jgi:hypothetical protein|nr:hypothetical protein [Urbifossiella sp.]
MSRVLRSNLADAVAIRGKLLDLEIRAARIAGRTADVATLESELRCLERLPLIALERRIGPGRTGSRATPTALVEEARTRIAELSTELRAVSARKRKQ